MGTEVEAIEAVESPTGGVLAIEVCLEPVQGAGVDVSRA